MCGPRKRRKSQRGNLNWAISREWNFFNRKVEFFNFNFILACFSAIQNRIWFKSYIFFLFLTTKVNNNNTFNVFYLKFSFRLLQVDSFWDSWKYCCSSFLVFFFPDKEERKLKWDYHLNWFKILIQKVRITFLLYIYFCLSYF
jgi:hypothetical protein